MMSLHLKGTGASPGIAIGPAFVLESGKVKIVKRRISRSDVAQEQERFVHAVGVAENEIGAILEDIPEELKEHSGVLKSHLLMLKDRMVFDRTLQTIENDCINAEWALDKAVKHIHSLFAQVKDSYIRERMEDIEYVVKRVQVLLASSEEGMNLEGMDEPCVVVAQELSPADTVQMFKQNILAFVTAAGSRTSHTAILARALGIPAVVGVEQGIRGISQDDTIIVDGLTGDIIISPDDDTIEKYTEKQQSYIRYRLEVIHNSALPAETRDGYRVKIKANMELLEEIPSVISHGAEGVGLFRTEFLYLASRELPSEETLYNAYREVIERLSPYPVTIRTLDVGGDKFVSSVSLDDEINPALGLRAIRLCLKEKGLFWDQLRAILRASVHGQVRILFPLVSGRTEIMQVKALLEQVKDELREAGVPFDESIKLGIMIEVPSAVMVADILAREVDFFSIGTNDLIQYALAIDRVNESVSHMYEPLHPGVIRMIHTSVTAAHNAGIEVAMCGEMAGESMYAPILLGMGIDELSMNALVIPKIKRIIRRCVYDDCVELVRRILDASSGSEIKYLLDDFLRHHCPEEFEPLDERYPEFMKTGSPLLN